MAFTVPVEIADIITGHVKDDKTTLLNLRLTSRAFQRIAEPFIYASVSFLTSTPRDVGDPDTDLVAVAHSFLLSITSGNGGRARYVKEIHLPDSAFRGEQYSLFQRILKSVTNLRDLRVYKLSWHTELLNLRTLFEDSQGQSSPPPFMLKAFMWYGSGRLDQAGFEWFLASQTSLERLVIPSFHSPVHIPRLPRLYAIHTASLGITRNVLETNRVTHLRVGLDDLERLRDVALRDVVVCITRISEFGKLAEAARRMPNMECLAMDTIKCSIPEALSRIDSFRGTKLRHLRFCPNQALRRWSSLTSDEDDPWDHDVIVNAFDRLPSLQYISFQLMSSKTHPEYYCFTRGEPLPMKLRSFHPVVMHCVEWWHDWVKDCAIVPFDSSDHPRRPFSKSIPS